MDLVREVLRLKLEQKKSNSMIASIVHISKTTVAIYVERASSAGLTTNESVKFLSDENSGAPLQDSPFF
jgi:DNA-binding transcriptional regulator LsrR (DeoR family)